MDPPTPLAQPKKTEEAPETAGRIEGGFPAFPAALAGDPMLRSGTSRVMTTENLKKQCAFMALSLYILEWSVNKILVCR
jgi:hypothetical protein